MQYPFHLDEKVEGIAVAEYTGIALLERNGSPNEWRISGIELDGHDEITDDKGHVLSFKPAPVAVPPASELYKRLAVALYKHDRHVIDQRWAIAVLEAIAHKQPVL
jgi:hypothetical protein